MFDDLRDRLEKANPPAGATTAPAPATRPSRIEDPLIRQGITDVTVLVPAFVLSQLTEAFHIGFLLFVPFLVIDLVVSNVLMAMGMQMMSPVTVSDAAEAAAVRPDRRLEAADARAGVGIHVKRKDVKRNNARLLGFSYVLRLYVSPLLPRPAPRTTTSARGNYGS